MSSRLNPFRRSCLYVNAHLVGCTVCERFGGRYAGVVHAARERLGAASIVDDATLARVRALLLEEASPKG